MARSPKLGSGREARRPETVWKRIDRDVSVSPDVAHRAAGDGLITNPADVHAGEGCLCGVEADPPTPGPALMRVGRGVALPVASSRQSARQRSGELKLGDD